MVVGWVGEGGALVGVVEGCGMTLRVKAMASAKVTVTVLQGNLNISTDKPNFGTQATQSATPNVSLVWRFHTATQHYGECEDVARASQLSTSNPNPTLPNPTRPYPTAELARLPKQQCC